MDTSTTTGTSPLVLPPGKGRHVWHLDDLMTFKAVAADTGGRLALWEQVLPHRSSPPLHVHAREDEAWYVLEGALTVRVAEDTVAATAGSFIWAPRGLPHTFRVDSPTARLLGIAVPAGFEEFFVATGRPAQTPTIPPPTDGPRDMAALTAASVQHEVDVLGPPMS